jgi:hypothetical protein
MSNETIDRDLRRVLQRSSRDVGVVVADDPLAAVSRRVAARRRRRRTRVRALAAVIVVGLVASAVAVARTRSPDSRQLDAVQSLPDAPPTTSAPATISVGPDGTAALPPLPLAPRGNAAILWSGSQIVVWGGDDESASNDPAFVDGAVYSPSTGGWRVMSPSPLPATTATPIGVATSDGVVFVRDRATAEWQPATDTWRPLPDAPGKVSDLTAVGSLLVSVSANAALDLASGSWRTLPAQPLELQRVAAASTGRELVAFGATNALFTSAAGMAFDPSTGQWRRLPDPGPSLGAAALAASWDGQRVVVANYDMVAYAFDPTDDSWHRLPDIPARFSEGSPKLATTTGETTAAVPSALAVLESSGRWVPLPYGALGSYPLVGTSLLVVIGRTDQNALFVFDPTVLATNPRRIQVGVARVDVPPGYTFVDAERASAGTAEKVTAELTAGDGSACTVSSGYFVDSTDPNATVPETTTVDGRPQSWVRTPASTSWTTNATGTDSVTITCTQADAATAVVHSVSFVS